MKTTLSLLLVLITHPLYAQHKVRDTAWLKGHIITAGIDAGIFEVCIPALQRCTRSNDQGMFVLPGIAFGNYTLIIYGSLQQSDTFRIAVDLDTTDLGDLPVKGKGMTLAETDLFTTVLLSDPASEGLEQLPAITDPGNPLDIAVRTWSALGYRFRGYDRNQAVVNLNGMPVQDLENSMLPRGLWAGLNGMLLSAATGYGLQYGVEAYGSLTGNASLDIKASDQRRQMSLSYGRSNGLWTNRLQLNYSTGMGNKGWAMAGSAGKCWSGQGYVPGTYYDEYSFYLGLSKRLNARHSAHFTAIATPMESGNTTAVTAEAIQLTGSPYYNPNWGFQQGRPRNARTSKALQPLLQLNYIYQANPGNRLELTASCCTGYNSYSAPDWYKAQDPRPDYYKNLPSAYKDDPVMAAQITAAWLNNPDKQSLNWARMYAANRLNADSINQYRSVYTLGADRADMRQYSVSAHYRQSRPHNIWDAGVLYEWQHTAHYRQMLDLLGGDYYVNVNQYAEQAYAGNTTFNQNDLNHPDRRVYTGDSYSYDYTARHKRATVWSQFSMDYKKINLSFAGHIRYLAYQREGHYRTGMFPSESYGKSATQHFLTYLAKVMGAYAFHTGHSLFLNAGISTTAPAFDHVFIAPRSRNTMLDHPVAARLLSAEAGYRINTRRLQGNLTLFITDRNRITEIRRFYHEDYRSFVNYVMEGIRIQHTGAELALEAKLTGYLTATAAAAWHKATYQSRPGVRVYKDNDTALQTDRHIAYLKGYYTGGPQSALLLGFNLRMPAYAYAGIRCRLLDRNYAVINPARRTDAAVGLTLPGSVEQQRILQQERLPGAFVTDLCAGKTFYLHKAGKNNSRQAAITARVGVSNIFNNKKIITDAYEQLRFDYKGQDPDRFPNKYSYAYGTIYTVELGLRL